MTGAGWQQLLDGWPWFRGEGSYYAAALAAIAIEAVARAATEGPA